MTIITAIELENFQSIKERTRIELKPITLLYGPNSAGKSTIFDAIELLQAVLDPSKSEEENKTMDLVNRWARHQDGKPRYRETTLAIEFILKSHHGGSYFFEESAEPFNKENISEKPRFLSFSYYPLDEEEDPHELRDIDGEGWEYELYPNYNHRIEVTLRIFPYPGKLYGYLSTFCLSIENKKMIELHQLETDKISYLSSDRLLTVYNQHYLDADYSLKKLKIFDLTKTPDEKEAISIKTTMRSISIHKLETERDQTHQDLSIHKEIEAMLWYFCYRLWEPLETSPKLIASDRTTPKPDDCLDKVSFFTEKSTITRTTFSPSDSIKVKSEFNESNYKDLIEAAYGNILIQARKPNSYWDSYITDENKDATEFSDEVRKIIRTAHIFKRINHHLENNLFTEKLYQLSCNASVLLPIDLENDPTDYYILHEPAIVRLFLVDKDRKKLDLHDVGSGIPFVLPVLYAAAAAGIGKIQQPELHLHPALQSSLADVFIEELNDKRDKAPCQFIIETHSEHFLLRLLRRIRDTEKGKTISNELKLTNEDIAIYYFDPQVSSNSTFVSRQLVTPLGDFYNDWPRGFFEERNHDLFD